MLDSDEVFLAISCFRVEILKMVFKDFLKKSQNSYLFVKSTLNTNFSFQVFCLKIRQIRGMGQTHTYTCIHTHVSFLTVHLVYFQVSDNCHD